MRLNEIEFSDATPVEGYGPGFFRVGGNVTHGPVCITSSGLTKWGGYDDVDLLMTLVGEVDVVFLGTGAETLHPPKDFRETLEAAGLGVEAMNTPSACRTYNVLLSEGRRIALAVLPV